MKKISKNIILMITVLSLIGFYGIPNKIPNKMYGDYNEKQTTIESELLIPNSAAYHAPIYIDGDDPANDWDDCDAVSGSGTSEDPYVIEDLEIDAGGSGSGIYIRDSTAYLNIVNSTSINAGSDIYDAGLKIYNCDNINISNCIFKNNSNYGIYLNYSSSNILTGNTATNNSNHGIHLNYSSSNILMDNMVANNSGIGILLYSSSTNTLAGNTVANNSNSGILLNYFSTNNIFSGNTVANNSNSGILLYSSSSNNILTGNTVANNDEGIYLLSSSNNILTGNTMANNLYEGIYLYSSSTNTFTGNTVTNNSNGGIILDDSSNNIFSDNIVSNNSFYGILFDGSWTNILTGNTFTNNTGPGIFLNSWSKNNGIFYNVIHANPVGIQFGITCSASIFDNWIWDNANYNISEYGVEASSTYVYNYYAEFCPLYDTDMDGLSDGEEFTLHTSPVKIDTDDDNFLDGYEVLYGSDPLDPLNYPIMPSEWYFEFTALLGENIALVEELWGWSNGNASLLLDLVEFLDGNSTLLETTYAIAIQNVAYLSALEGNLEGNVTEIRAVLDELGITIGDTDYDGLDDLDEIIYGTSLTCADTDCDNLNDAFEVKMGTDPLNDDSDGDSWLDGVESAAGTNPLDATDYPGSDSSPKNNLTGLIIGGIGGTLAIFGIVTLIFVKQRKKKV